MSERAGGTAVRDEDVVAAHPDLRPELERELATLALLERARERGLQDTWPGAGAGRLIDPLGEEALDGYTVVREMHRGGQGVVYEGLQKSTGRRVAVKVMRDGLFGSAPDAARFAREVRILAEIDHPGVVGILGSGVRGGHFFYAMEFVDGEPIDVLLSGQGPGRILPAFEQVCDAVNAAHLRGIIHRDLKPGNILMDAEGRPRVLDFGLARIVADQTASLAVTAAGQFIGSVPWASPEQARGEHHLVDTRADVYSLGVVLYQLLTGRFPYVVDAGPRDVLDNIVNAEPVRPRSLDRRIDDELEAIVLKCLRKDREGRYQTAGALADDLRRYGARLPVLARPPSVAYQVRTFARRHRGLVGGAVATGASLLLGFAGVTAALFDAASARRAAELRRDDAERSSYVANIAAADGAIRSQDVSTARARLDSAPPALRGWEWAYLNASSDASVATIATDAVDAGGSPDGSAIAVIRRTGTLDLLDADTLRARWSAPLPLEVRGSADTAIGGFSRDGALLATAHGPHGLIWDARQGRVVSRLEFPGSQWETIVFAFHPGTPLVTAAGRDGRMLTLDYRAGAVVRKYPSGTLYSAVDVAPDGRTMAVLNSRGVDLLDPDTAAPLGALTLPPGTPDGSWGRLCISSDGSTLACTFVDSVLVYDLGTRRLRSVIRGHRQRMRGLALSADGAIVATCAWDRTIQVWNARTGARTAVLLGHTGEPGTLSFVRGGTRLLSCATDGTARLWDHAAPRDAPLGAGGLMVRGLTITGDGRLLANTWNAPAVWRITGRVREELPALPDLKYSSSDLSRDGSRLVTVTADAVSVWRLPEGRPAWSVGTPRGNSDSLAKFSPDGTRVVAQLGPDRELRVLDTVTGGPVCTIPGWSARYDWAFDPSGRAIASGHPEGGVGVWDASTGAILHHLPAAESGRVEAVAFSPDGTLLAAGGDSGTLDLWDWRAEHRVTTLRGMQPSVWAAAFSPDGSRLATGSQDRSVRVWDTRTWQELLVLRGHAGTVMALAWSPDGGVLASGAYDGTVRLWDGTRRADAP